MDAFACPPDCGWCCTHLHRDVADDEAEATALFRDALRGLGIYGCADAVTTGLALSNAEAAGLREEAARRGMRVDIHPRTFLLDGARRVAVTLDWHMPYVSCPFYADFKCTAYDLRPFVCRAYPVFSPAPKWRLAPECPKAAPTLASGVRLGTFLKGEAAARRAVERANASLDVDAQRLLDSPGARFRKGLAAREAAERLGRYRTMTPEDWLACAAPARSSTS